MKQKGLKNPWIKLVIGLAICFLFLFWAIVEHFILSSMVIAFVVGSFLALSGAVEILTGKDIVSRINQLKPIDLCIYMSIYIAGLSSILWLLDYFFPTGWQMALRIMLIVSLAFSVICYLSKKILGK